MEQALMFFLGDKEGDFMKLALHQPYFFPYIGYWQLINYVDVFVVYDDVNYIKGGWISRNRILLNGAPHYFHVTLKGSSSFKHINEIEVDTNRVFIRKNLCMLENAYAKAPYYSQVMPVLKDILSNCEGNLAKYLFYQIQQIAEYLGIKKRFFLSSSIDKNNMLKGEEKVIEICKKLGGTEYYNAIGGRSLYDSDHFAKERIKLRFLETKSFEYKQYNHEFIPNLSIIDVMMFNSVEKIQGLLQEYNLSEGYAKNNITSLSEIDGV